MIALVLLLGQAPADIDFDRDIRPILSDKCYTCHGPDTAKRKAGLRLDTKEGAFADLKGTRVVVAGDIEKSELFVRITSGDEEERMPPAKSGARLSDKEVGLIRTWIEQGSPWARHWAFVRPERPALPKTRRTGWVRNGIDAFVLARLEREGLAPSPEAARPTLIRRVTLDLTGLPPTPEEVDAFLADDSPDAYGKLVDRLLASPRYGERMAVRWLDAARYADTSGYQNDGRRSMWRWRDWVIAAYNDNMPFDRFTIEQLAGDLLPEPTLDQRIATAFNRNHRGNSEGGIIPAEYQVEYVVDRVDTTATIWLGLTVGCARCHEHKYDPISQKEFYRLFAYFNTIPEYGRAIKEGNSPPYLQAPTKAQKEELGRLDEELAGIERRVRELDPTVRELVDAWNPVDPKPWTVTRGLVAHYALDGEPGKSTPVGGDPGWEKGPVGRAAVFDGMRHLDAGKVDKFSYFDKFSFSVWVRPAEEKLTGTILSKMTNTARADGYALHLEKGRLQVNLVKRWLDDSIRVETKRAVKEDKWTHVAVTYDGSRVAKGIVVYFNGEPQELAVHHDFLNQNFHADEPLRVGAGNGGGFRGGIDEVHVFGRRLSPDEVGWLATAEPLDALAARKGRTAFQEGKLRAAYLERAAAAPVRKVFEGLTELRERRERFVEALPTVMIMEEMAVPRATHVLKRGEYDNPAERVTAGVPEALHPMREGLPGNRLGFAKWLVDPANPLTARVIVNRWWQMYFGSGLSRTIEDFGSQGERPSHPKLLDWLATEFIESGWNTKRMQKTIVMSAAYRQSSRIAPPFLERDPDNRLLARGPRFRLPAEMVRDQALAAAGLLSEKIGGPSVKPYQPAGLWQEIASDKVYTRSKGRDLYRRSLYTYFKRTVAPPTMATFDAPGREACTVRQTRTNTPLQALALLNDVTYVEAARVLAERMIRSGEGPDARIRWGFRRVLARPPAEREAKILGRALERGRKRYRADVESARRLISVGESKADPKVDAVELAAMTTVASLLLNLDEAVTKE